MASGVFRDGRRAGRAAWPFSPRWPARCWARRCSCSRRALWGWRGLRGLLAALRRLAGRCCARRAAMRARRCCRWPAARRRAGRRRPRGLARRAPMRPRRCRPRSKGATCRWSAWSRRCRSAAKAAVRFRFEVESARWAGDADSACRARPAHRAGLVRGQHRLWGARRAGLRAEPRRRARAVHAGERWRMTVRLKAPHGNLNPHGFDYELWLWEQGVQATGYVRTGARDAAPAAHRRDLAPPGRARARGGARRRSSSACADRRLAGVIAALVTGDQNAIERADWDVFRATGVAHLMSISGLHITMFAWLAALVVGALWRRSSRLMLRWPAPHAALVGGVLLAALYALFSGWGVPSQRTVWMLATVALLRLTGRRWPWPFVWLLRLRGGGGARSLGADAGRLLAELRRGGRAVRQPSRRTPADGGAGRRQRGCARMLREQWVVTLALTPLTPAAVPAGLGGRACWPTPSRFPGSRWWSRRWPCSACCCRRCGTLAAWAVQALGAAAAVAGAAAAAPRSSTPAPPLWAGVAGVAGGVLLAMRLPWSLRAAGPAAAAAGAALAGAAAAGRASSSCWRPTSGRATRCWCAPRPTACSTTPARATASKAMPATACWCRCCARCGERLDTVVLSHRDSDHTGGAPAVLAMQPQAELLQLDRGRASAAGAAAGAALRGRPALDWDGVRLRDPASRSRPTTRGVAKPNAVSLRAAHRQRPRRRAAGRRHRARCRKRALVARTPRAAGRPAAGAAPRQQDLVERRAARRRAAAHRAGAGRLPQPLRPSGRGGGRALSRARHPAGRLARTAAPPAGPARTRRACAASAQAAPALLAHQPP